ncbi:hypothetical protein MQE22_08710 [Acidithiobacillus sp. YTS05]|nr:hypothetical protein MQE22_08710 [Acidithiobacillus sp. YTS05]
MVVPLAAAVAVAARPVAGVVAALDSTHSSTAGSNTTSDTAHRAAADNTPHILVVVSRNYTAGS